MSWPGTSGTTTEIEPVFILPQLEDLGVCESIGFENIEASDLPLICSTSQQICDVNYPNITTAGPVSSPAPSWSSHDIFAGADVADHAPDNTNIESLFPNSPVNLGSSSDNNSHSTDGSATDVSSSDSEGKTWIDSSEAEVENLKLKHYKITHKSQWSYLLHLIL